MKASVEKQRYYKRLLRHSKGDVRNELNMERI